MKKGQVVTGVVEKVVFPNKGIVHTEEGNQVIVKNVIPGQKVSASVNKIRKGKAEGRLLEVLEKSELEEEAVCPHFGSCGGCSYQNLNYENQIALKTEQLRDLLEKVVSETCDFNQVFEGIKSSPRQFGYRNKMEFSFGDAYKDGPLALGMHKRGSFYDIVTVDECKIVDADYNKILNGVLTFFQEEDATFYHRLRHTGYLRHLLVRKAVKTKEILIDLVTTTQDIKRKIEEVGQAGEKIHAEDARQFGKAGQAGIDKRAGEDKAEAVISGENVSGENVAALLVSGKNALGEKAAAPFVYGENVPGEKEMLERFASMLTNLPLDGKIVGILHTRNDRVADVVANEGTDILYGQDYFYEELLGLKFKISPFSFFQTNSLGAEVLYETAREFIRDSYKEESGLDFLKDKVIYDLYSGTGTIAQMLAPVAEKVIGVEIVEEAVEAAKINAELNGLHNCEFIAGDVLKVLDGIEEKPGFIVLDPPRDGIHPKALEKIISYGVEKMVYISCKPTSLARDLEVLQARGYEVKRICGVDMFPGTGHVETVCLLTRKAP